MPDLLQEALTRAAEQHAHLSPPQSAHARLSDHRSDAGVHSDEDDTVTPLHSRAVSRTGTPRAGTPRGGSRAGSRSGSPTRSSSARKRQQERAKKESSLDPLLRFKHELSLKIFGQLEIEDLLTCRQVSKKWKASQTLNYCWYIECNDSTYIDPDEKPSWTRKDAKQDWAARYRSIHRRDDLDYADARDAEYERARAEGYLTPKEQREAKWAEESDQLTAGVDKLAMREHYKGLKNSKPKGKGGQRGPARDVTAWEETYDST
ncbi:uncharacterized protein L969DRAFT_84584 [Mixia osmundae IAM 14324]|nr:uncharacterized protein L969DRAFT_84584 [Mixia osmundae IAM 14324]KEI42710.1 hypothetical protein L969DRAFT_84584 [Mixia osmundae IAM 14324]